MSLNEVDARALRDMVKEAVHAALADELRPALEETATRLTAIEADLTATAEQLRGMNSAAGAMLENYGAIASTVDGMKSAVGHLTDEVTKVTDSVTKHRLHVTETFDKTGARHHVRIESLEKWRKDSEKPAPTPPTPAAAQDADGTAKLAEAGQ